MIGRVCLHEAHRLADNGSVVPPTYGTGLLQLTADADEAFRARVVAAFRSNAQCMEMSIRQHAAGSVVSIGSTLHGLSDSEFVHTSRQFADALSSSQSSRTIPGGLVVVFDGTVGYPSSRFFAVMKAELHEGFLKTNDLQARFVSNLFLSPKQKLYKIGLFISDATTPRPPLPAGWTASVYDSAMKASQRDAAATYFYSTFLGLDIPDNAAHQVRKFFDSTKTFISSADIDPEDKVDLYNSLYSYLKVDQGNTVQVSEFSDRFMQPEVADEYKRHMQRAHFPVSAIQKDLSEVKGVLKLRRMRFPRSITLSGPPDAMKELVSFAPIEMDGGEKGTQITIRGQIESQE